MIERDVKRQIGKLLAKYEWFFWMPAANAYGRGGVSDYLAIRRGTFIAIEAKVGKNPPSPLQVRFMTSIRENGGMAIVVNENNLDELEALLAIA